MPFRMMVEQLTKPPIDTELHRQIRLVWAGKQRTHVDKNMTNSQFTILQRISRDDSQTYPIVRDGLIAEMEAGKRAPYKTTMGVPPQTAKRLEHRARQDVVARRGRITDDSLAKMTTDRLTVDAAAALAGVPPYALYQYLKSEDLLIEAHGTPTMSDAEILALHQLGWHWTMIAPDFKQSARRVRALLDKR